VGENGAGKTNLLEALHLGTQGFSPRTRTDTQLVRFGQDAAAVGLRLDHAAVSHTVRVRIAAGVGKTAELDGSRLSSPEALRRRFAAVVFTPDRIAVVKGAPAVRRAYFDRILGRIQPAQAGLPQEFAAALAQRNAALRRVQLGLSGRDALSPWTSRVAELGAALVQTRLAVTAELGPGFAAAAAELGLPGANLRYEGEAPTEPQLEARLDADLQRGATGAGPHLHDIRILAGDRDLRSFGSQGEQRLALLALLLAEAELLKAAPLVLLDDVLSELDGRRRRVLAERVAIMEQVVITATQRAALPLDPAQVVEVSPGTAV
jgi:DNA replication and repair protein RecF